MRLEFVLHCYTDTCHNHTAHRGYAGGGAGMRASAFKRSYSDVRNPLDT